MKLFIWFLLFISVLGSPGDKSKRFKRCLKECEKSNCHGAPSSWNFTPFNVYLSFLHWDCYQDCDYQCQQLVTAERIKKGNSVVQFHGKWPFRRIFGIQEFISSLFSIGNLIPHVQGFKKLVALDTDKIQRRHLNLLILQNIITCIAWICSTIFHIRDFPITEKLDYFMAGATVLSGFYTISVRMFKLYLPDRRIAFYMMSIFCLSLYIGHVTRLIVDWSYTYNMRANIFIAILQNIGLYYLCYDLYSKYYELPPSNNHAKYIGKILLPIFFRKSSKLYCLYPILLSIIITFGMSLEIFDFPPVFFDLVDAHSLWHLVTIIPVVFGWYDWLIWDVKENIQLKEKKD